MKNKVKIILIITGLAFFLISFSTTSWAKIIKLRIDTSKIDEDLTAQLLHFLPESISYR